MWHLLEALETSPAEDAQEAPNQNLVWPPYWLRNQYKHFLARCDEVGLSMYEKASL
ncbi:hypothetical protein SESBI_22535 [Sesbania bispinosa]|nr:hypothetical protein SESBI_22535 [Sesbania bispinosa]